MARSSPLRLLIVEDDPAEQLLLTAALQDLDCLPEFQVVDGGNEALELLRGPSPFTPDLIVTDLNMPRVSGFDLLLHLKQDARLRRLPVIVLSTSDRQQDVQRSYDLWASSYLQKPSTFERYQALFRELCAYWGEHAQLPTRPHPG